MRTPAQQIYEADFAGSEASGSNAAAAAAAAAAAMAPSTDSSSPAMQAVLAMAVPVLTRLAGASGVGLVTGLAIKRVLHLVAVFLGLAFLALQLMSQAGYITVHWDQMERAAVGALDTNHDGRLDEADMQYYVRGLGLLTAGLPNAGGFMAGLLMGLRL